MILDIKAKGTIQEFIAKEVAAKVGAIYRWNDQSFGIPSGGAGSSFTSRDLMKFGTAVMQGGKFNGEQFLSADYVAQVMALKEKKGYYYYFHDRPEKSAGKTLRFNSGVGAGGQYMGTFPELIMVQSEAYCLSSRKTSKQKRFYISSSDACAKTFQSLI